MKTGTRALKRDRYFRLAISANVRVAKGSCCKQAGVVTVSGLSVHRSAEMVPASYLSLLQTFSSPTCKRVLSFLSTKLLHRRR